MLTTNQRTERLMWIADMLIHDLAEEKAFTGEMHYPLINKIMTLHEIANELKKDNDEKTNEGSE
jgi:hypothetical protein